MTRLTKQRSQATYDAIDRFVDVALRGTDSLFTPGVPVWSPANLQELHARFVERPDESGSTFVEKFRGQLTGAPSEVVQLAAEVLFVQLLTPYQMSAKAKRKLLEDVLSVAADPPAISDGLLRALDQGLVSDQSFFQQRPSHLTLIIELLLKWNQLDPERRDELLRDPWAFKAFVESVPVKFGQPMAQILLFFVHPDSFESITSRRHKSQICEAFRDRVEDPSKDPDQLLLQIRAELTAKYGDGFHFYDAELRSQWNPGKEEPGPDPWPVFMEWARRFRESEHFDRSEVEYKLAIAANITEAKQAVLLGDSSFHEKVKRAFGPPNNLTAWQLHDRFVRWCEEHTADAHAALAALWGQGDTLVRVRSFLSGLPETVSKGAGGRATLASFLLMADDPHANPMYRARAFQTAYKLAGHRRLPPRAEAVQQYSFALEFLDRMISASADMDVPIANRLEAQSVLWSMIKHNEAPPDWKPSDWAAFEEFRSGVVKEPDEGMEDDGEADEDEELPSLEALADSLLLDVAFLDGVRQMLEEKRQVIFYGPPGTGKTWVAQKLAERLAASPDHVRLVQFHPSYTYEDFIEGFRPAMSNGQPSFRLVDGPLKSMAAQAAKERDKRFILVIDEINRGNLSKVLGELYFLLEYRQRGIRLLYSDAEFRLPENLWIIGTMNTADRSISLVDAALRRRFYFVEFFPDRWPVEGLLRRWLKRSDPQMEWVAGLVDSANHRLGDRHLAIGPSHFMKEGLTEDWVRMIWNHAVLPYVEEQFFGEPDRVSDFYFDRLRSELLGGEAPAAEEPDSATAPAD